ncbi:hypothetical protein BpHYR1_007965, partial [Brachionus plicatilis]
CFTLNRRMDNITFFYPMTLKCYQKTREVLANYMNISKNMSHRMNLNDYIKNHQFDNISWSFQRAINSIPQNFIRIPQKNATGLVQTNIH